MKTFLSPLTPEQEMECLKKMKDGDLEAKKELTLRNMRLVAHVAKKYQNSDEDMEDLISIGTIGLIKAISTYKEDYGSRLATYAARCIDNELLMHFRSKKKTAREVSLYERSERTKRAIRFICWILWRAMNRMWWRRSRPTDAPERCWHLCRSCFPAGSAIS